MAGFWEQLFGPSRETVWRQLSEEINADYVEGGFWGGDRVEAKVGNWVITMDVYTVSTGKSSVSYTRIRAPYVNRDGFQFRIYRKGFFSDWGKEWFGLQDVEVGDPYFDDAFIIQGSSEAQLRALFAKERLRKMFEAQPTLALHVADDEGWFGKHFPEGVDELYFQVTGIIKDVPRLRGLFDLFTELLGQLHEIGSAYAASPFEPFTVPTEDILLRPANAPSTDPNMLLRPASADAPTTPSDELLRSSEPSASSDVS
jgi:hypothetical protein